MGSWNIICHKATAWLCQCSLPSLASQLGLLQQQLLSGLPRDSQVPRDRALHDYVFPPDTDLSTYFKLGDIQIRSTAEMNKPSALPIPVFLKWKVKGEIRMKTPQITRTIHVGIIGKRQVLKVWRKGHPDMTFRSYQLGLRLWGPVSPNWATEFGLLQKWPGWGPSSVNSVCVPQLYSVERMPSPHEESWVEPQNWDSNVSPNSDHVNGILLFHNNDSTERISPWHRNPSANQEKTYS